MKEKNFLLNDMLLIGFGQFWKKDQSLLLSNPFRFYKAVLIYYRYQNIFK